MESKKIESIPYSRILLDCFFLIIKDPINVTVKSPIDRIVGVNSGIAEVGVGEFDADMEFVVSLTIVIVWVLLQSLEFPVKL